MSEPSTSTAPAKSISSIATRQTVEKKYNIDLIGNTSHQITGAKLPSNRQVLQVFFHNMHFVNLDQIKSAKLAIDSALIFWKQARIPTRNKDKCVSKLLDLYTTWKNIRKTQSEKRSNTQNNDANQFVESLDDLFDISAANAMQTMKIEEDKQFLEMQRQKGRPGSMIGVDMALFGREQRSLNRKEREDARRAKHEEEMARQAGISNVYLSLFWPLFIFVIFSIFCSCC